MKVRSCLVVWDGGTSSFQVLEELENGVLLALRPADTARIFEVELAPFERLRLLEECLVGIHPAENRFLAFFELKINLLQARSLLLRMLIDEGRETNLTFSRSAGKRSLRKGSRHVQ